ncbi:MAG: hypothetical protein WCP10_06770 [Desulfuromonadales bacterium]
MKVYLFDVSSGLYEGEDYVEPNEVNVDEGITDIAPPVNISGQLPIYDRSLGNWKLVTNDCMKKSEKCND